MKHIVFVLGEFSGFPGAFVPPHREPPRSLISLHLTLLFSLV